MYLSQDNSLKAIARLSSWEGHQDAIECLKCMIAFGSSSNASIEHIVYYVIMSAGIVRGVLSGLGLIGVALPRITNLSQCRYVFALPLIIQSSSPWPSDGYIPNKASETFMCSYVVRQNPDASPRLLRLAATQIDPP